MEIRELEGWGEGGGCLNQGRREKKELSRRKGWKWMEKAAVGDCVMEENKTLVGIEATCCAYQGELHVQRLRTHFISAL